MLALKQNTQNQKTSVLQLYENLSTKYSLEFLMMQKVDEHSFTEYSQRVKLNYSNTKLINYITNKDCYELLHIVNK